ncbi:threonine aldolase family protein [Paenibacillus sp. GCM10023252]|uniref:threonine aldolase family protein n=1 Tax=Paenibacillus sp. GCM10023252 TaxID=3252649 RepID=UPI00360DC21D
MNNNGPTLLQAFNNTTYPVTGHGPRHINVLTEALQSVDPHLESDVYGQGELITQFERKLASLLGLESAVFFPSGTMAQQIALRIWCDEKGLKRVAYHPLAHVEIHEQDGLKELHHIEPILLADKNRLITLEDVTSLSEEIACLLLELPQREIGGQLPDFEELEAISAYCRSKGIKLHLDGARLFEILPFYNKTAAEVCRLFDSVYVSFYKGIGGIAGAILAGPAPFTQQAKVWKRRHGGDLISLYPYILSADYYMERRLSKMGEYYEGARALAARYRELPKTTVVPAEPVSNLFHVHFELPAEEAQPYLLAVCESTGVGLSSHLRPTSAGSCYFEVSIGDRYAHIPTAKLDEAFGELAKQLGTPHTR